jgi:CRP-like cAMP-binding protein
MVNKSTKDIIKSVPLFRNLSPVQINMIEKVARIEKMKKNSFIFYQNDKGSTLFIVLSGMVRIQYKSSDGRVKTFAMLSEGEFFGEMAILTESSRSASAEAIVETDVMLIEKEGFMELLKKDAAFCIEILKVVCARLETADRQIETLTFKNLPGRVAGQMFELAKKYGKKQDGGILIDIRITHQELADMVGTNRESISKIIAQFKAENSLDVKGHLFFISDAEKLASWR